jgi:hypothetical protein
VLRSAVADDGNGPTVRRHRTGRQDDVEVQRVDALDDWRTGARRDRRDILARMHHVVGRFEPAEGNAPDRARDDSQRKQIWTDGRRQRGACRQLLVEDDRRDVAEGVDGAAAIWPKTEVRRRRRGREDLIADLLEQIRRALGGEHAERGNLPRLHARLVRRPFRSEQGPAVPANLIVAVNVVTAISLEFHARLDRKTSRVAHAASDDQRVSCMFASV